MSTVPVSRVLQFAVSSRRQAPRRRDDAVARMAELVHDADRLRVGCRPIARRHVARHVFVPCRALRLRFGGPLLGRAVAGQCSGQRRQPEPRVAHHGQGHVLARVVPPDIQRDEPRAMGEGGPGSCGEVLQPRPDAEDHVRPPGDRVGAVRTGDPDGTDVQRVAGQQVGAAGDGFDHRHPVRLGKVGQLGQRPGILHSAASDDHRPLRVAERCGGIRDLIGVRSRAADAVDALGEEALGVVGRPSLHVLRQTRGTLARNRRGPAAWPAPQAAR